VRPAHTLHAGSAPWSPLEMGVIGRTNGCMLRSHGIQITPEILRLIARIDEFKGASRALGALAPDQLSALPSHDRRGHQTDRRQPQHTQAALPSTGRTWSPEPARQRARCLVRTALICLPLRPFKNPHRCRARAAPRKLDRRISDSPDRRRAFRSSQTGPRQGGHPVGERQRGATAADEPAFPCGAATPPA